MSDLFGLASEQMKRLQPFFPKSHGKARVDDRRVLSGIVFVNRNGLRCRDAPSAYGPHKTLYNRLVTAAMTQIGSETRCRPKVSSYASRLGDRATSQSDRTSGAIGGVAA